MLRRSRAEVRAILVGGFIAGSVDIGAACLIYFTGPVVILKAIAGGLLGHASFQGGAATAALGLALQWLMSCLIAAIYGVATLNMVAVRSRWILSGLAYGAVVFGVMNYVVVPLSAIGEFPTFTVAKFIANLLAMFLFGLIIAFFASRATR
jgi:hypothetical protein